MRDLPDPGFSGDDGAAARALEAALATYDTDPDAHHAETLTVLQHERLLVPVVAVAGSIGLDERGLARDESPHESRDDNNPDDSTDMATVLLRGPHGRTALLAFSGTAALRRWDPDARPVPVTVRTAAQAARQDGATALVVDVAGPVRFVVESDDLAELALGHVLARVNDRYAWVRPGR